MSFSDSIFLFVLALLLFGPKKLPVLARELGKWVGEFRRASNEFRMQMEEELRMSEQAERQKEIAAMEAAAPVAPALPASESDTPPVASDESPALPSETATPLPIATSGELSIMPPATGLPVPQTKASPMGALLDSIPVTQPGNGVAAESSPEPTAMPGDAAGVDPIETELPRETAAHGQ